MASATNPPAPTLTADELAFHATVIKYVQAQVALMGPSPGISAAQAQAQIAQFAADWTGWLSTLYNQGSQWPVVSLGRACAPAGPGAPLSGPAVVTLLQQIAAATPAVAGSIQAIIAQLSSPTPAPIPSPAPTGK